MRTSARLKIATTTFLVFIIAIMSAWGLSAQQTQEHTEKFDHALEIEESDPATAFEIYLGLVHENHTEAKVRLASLIIAEGMEAPGQTDNLGYAIELLDEASEEGSANAFYGLGLMHEQGVGAPHDPDKASDLYQQAADKGEPRAMFRLGQLYLEGFGVEENPSKAVHWFQKSAEKDNTDGLFNLAHAYLNGIGDLPADVDKAIELLEHGSDLGDAHAMASLGYILFDNEFDRHDPDKAYQILKQSASKGNPYGQSNLADCYRLGVGTDVNMKKAYHWYSQAARAGLLVARYQLAVMYRKGEGVERDTDKAREIFQELANMGDAEAAHALRVMDSEAP